MTVAELIAQLGALDPAAKVEIVDEDTGIARGIDRACASEDPPDDGSSEVWIVPSED